MKFYLFWGPISSEILSFLRYLLTGISLEAILNSLRPMAPSQPPSSTPPPSTPPSPARELSETLNQFLILDTIQESSHESPTAAMSRYEASIGDRAALSTAYVGMEDMTMEKVFVVHGLVLVSCDLVATNLFLTSIQELDILCSKLKDIWQQASTGAISLIAAAWLTDGAYNMIRQMLQTGLYPHILGNTTHKELYELAQKAHSLPAWTYPDEIRFPIHHQVFASLHGLWTPMTAMLEAVEQHKKGALDMTVEKVKLAEVVTVARNQDENPRQVQSERKWMSSIITSMRQMDEAALNDPSSDFLWDFNVMMEDTLDPDQKGDITYKHKTPTVVGLMFLVESTKSFMLPEDAPPPTTNCRLKALKFAKDLKASVMAVIKSRPIVPGSGLDYPICTDDKLIKGLKQLDDSLSTFSSQARWDFYYQAPWVAGGQMLWMLSQANDYGMVLCNRRRYVGAVLHLYNCLKQLGKIEVEPVLLERLCDLLGKQVFRSGSPPSTDFFKVWARYVGREREYDPRYHHTTPFYESYSPEEDRLVFMPRDRLWRNSTPKLKDDKRICLSRISHFYALESIKYHVQYEEGLAAMARLLHVKEKGGDATDEEREKVRDILASEFLAITIEKMQPVIVSELEGEFPVARINWFGVYLTCTGILESLGKIMHANIPDRPANAEQRRRMELDFAVAGLRWIEMFFCDVDQGTINRRTKKAWLKKAEPLIKQGLDVIGHEMRERTTADYVWQI